MLIFWLTRFLGLIYSREIFEMFWKCWVIRETGRAHVSQRVQMVGSFVVSMAFFLVMTSDGCRKRVIISLKVGKRFLEMFTSGSHVVTREPSVTRALTFTGGERVLKWIHHRPGWLTCAMRWTPSSNKIDIEYGHIFDGWVAINRRNETSFSFRNDKLIVRLFKTWILTDSCQNMNLFHNQQLIIINNITEHLDDPPLC